MGTRIFDTQGNYQLDRLVSSGDNHLVALPASAYALESTA
jgi:hypothetical protein